MSIENVLRDATTHITRIEQGRIEGTRPRSAGSNARLGVHGLYVRIPLTRITTSDGQQGFGLSGISSEQAKSLLGRPVRDAFIGEELGVQSSFRALEFPLLDLIGQMVRQPVYKLFPGATPGDPQRVRCYDTSLYFDDLDIQDDTEAAALIAQEARDGWERGHRAFKIKVGRGGRHMPLEEGTRRDIAVIRAVREAVGPDAALMLDANNGWNLNLTKRVLGETADCRIYWIEEAFHEDPVLYRDLKEWLRDHNLSIRIADGEGEASPSLIHWAREGLVDVIQYDIFGYGFSRWLALGNDLADTQIGCGPHHYGAHLGNYVTGHIAHALPHFQYVEWDHVTNLVIDDSAYSVQEGEVVLPDLPGFGLTLDEVRYQKSVQEGGFFVSL